MLKKLAIVLMSFISCISGASANSTESPNILMILVDDLGWKDLGSYGSKIYRTPNIDKLADEGTKFTQAYTAAHICSPTRASIVTGQHPARLHLTDWIPGHKAKGKKLKIPKWTKHIEARHTTIGEMLQEAGYTTAWIGKWHLGGAPKGEGKLGGRKTKYAQYHGFDAGYQDWALNSDKRPNDPKGVFEVTDQAIDFIEKAGDKPWFVTISHYSVHTPIRFNNKVRKKYRKMIRSDRNKKYADYAAMVEPLDDSVGQVMDYLKKKNLDKNTMVIFYSDNGGLRKKTDIAPLRAGKGNLYEGGVRVPLIVRWPGKVPQGKVSNEVMTSVDLYPTFAELAKSDNVPDVVDGVSILPHLTKNEKIDRDTIYWHYPHYHNGMPSSAMRKGNYKLLHFFEDNRLELYDLANDIGESKNLVSEKPELTKELYVMLDNWRKRVDAQMMTKNPSYKE